MTAEHAVHIIIAGISHDGFFKLSDEAHDVFHFGFDVGAERPRAEPNEAAGQIHDTIAAEEDSVADIADVSEPAEILHDGVEFVTVHDQQTASVGSEMDRVFLKRHAGIRTKKSVEKLVVVAGDVDDLCALAAFPEDFLDYVVVLLRPEDTAAKSPDIDEVADEVERLELRLFEELQKRPRLTAASAQMNV